jgi:group II intron reverse transcriptase/maturase
MQNAETVLGVMRERGRRGLPCDELYRQLFNPQLYLVAYGRIYANKGAMTPGATTETVDGMSMEKIEAIIDAMRHERYRFSPVKRIHIPKKKGGSRATRPLGLPPWSDKLVGEVIRMLLEAYYEPRFSGRSHGFRPGRGCHTALAEVKHVWKGTTWFVEGDIADCFGSLDHQVMLETLAGKIHDNRFLRLIGSMLKAGYLEDWVWHATLSGAPQGGVVSPLLSNIYLHRLDTFVEKVLIPQYTRGQGRRDYPAHIRAMSAARRARRRGDRTLFRDLRRQMQSLPSLDPNDPGYRRLRYVRYADDVLLGFAGPKAEAEQIKVKLATFLRDELKLELSSDKTLITHARTRAARFVGYEITTQHADRRITKGRRAANGRIRLRVPLDVIRAKCALYRAGGKPVGSPALANESDYTIVATYGSVYRGVVQYYQLAADVYRFHRLGWVMATAMLKTLAWKHKSTVFKMAAKHKAKVETPYGPRRCYEARLDRGAKATLVARFGGIPLRRQDRAVIYDHQPAGRFYPHRELVTRFLNGICEICGGTDSIQVHHVRKLANLGKPGPLQPEWARLMASRRRKTLVVCEHCHQITHSTTPPPQ